MAHQVGRLQTVAVGDGLEQTVAELAPLKRAERHADAQEQRCEQKRPGRGRVYGVLNFNRSAGGARERGSRQRPVAPAPPRKIVSRRIRAPSPRLEFAKLTLEKALVAVSPGIGFGAEGEGYVRFSLIENEQRLRQATRGIKKLLAD